MGSSNHICSDCRIEFTSLNTQTAHSRAYFHMQRTHNKKITIGCVPNCALIPKPVIQETVAVKKRVASSRRKKVTD